MTYSGYTTCAHCGWHGRARVNGKPYAHDDLSTGKRCITTPRKTSGRLPLGDAGMTAQFSVSITRAQVRALDEWCHAKDKSRAQVVREALAAFGIGG